MGDGFLVLLSPRGCSATNFPLAAACALSARVDQSAAAGEPKKMVHASEQASGSGRYMCLNWTVAPKSCARTGHWRLQLTLPKRTAWLKPSACLFRSYLLRAGLQPSDCLLPQDKGSPQKINLIDRLVATVSP